MLKIHCFEKFDVNRSQKSYNFNINVSVYFNTMFFYVLPNFSNFIFPFFLEFLRLSLIQNDKNKSKFTNPQQFSLPTLPAKQDDSNKEATEKGSIEYDTEKEAADNGEKDSDSNNISNHSSPNKSAHNASDINEKDELKLSLDASNEKDSDKQSDNEENPKQSIKPYVFIQFCLNKMCEFIFRK